MSYVNLYFFYALKTFSCEEELYIANLSSFIQVELNI